MPDFPPVQETSERMVFLVRSDTNPKRQYRVDLLANSGAGKCACTDHGTRRQPNLDTGRTPWTKSTACKHLFRAGLHVLRTTLPEMAAQEDRPANRQRR
jgi:hypothetical protein